jgi:hypothetical protein
MENAGIFGPSKSGKTTLAKALSAEYWRTQKLKSLVLDPWLENWGPHAVVLNDEDKFWQAVWASKNCIVIVEEATQTINRNRDLNKVFTAIRHNHHNLIVVGHNGSSLLPIMRQQLEKLYLFLQSEKAAKIWVEETACPQLLQATTLGQYEFLFYKRFSPVRRLKLSPP